MSDPRSKPNGRRWTFLTNHAAVLVCVAQEPSIRLREIADRVGITERAAQRIVGELVREGYVARVRDGRRNQYAIHPHMPMRRSEFADISVGDLVAAVGSTRRA